MHSFFSTSDDSHAIPEQPDSVGNDQPVAQNLFNSSLYPKAIAPARNCSKIRSNNTASAFNVNQGDIKADNKATDKDTIRPVYPGLPEQSIDGTRRCCVQLLLQLRNLQHRGRLDPDDRQQPVNDARIG